MSKRTLSALGIAAIVAAGGVTAAVAGSATRDTQPTRTAPAGKPAAKSTTAKARASTSGGVVESPAQSANAESYWTREQMDAAIPRMPTRPGGSATKTKTTATAPKLAGTARSTAPTGPSVKKVTATKTKTAVRSTRAANDHGATSGDATQGATDYWTDEMMDGAVPRDTTVPGGGNGGSQGSGGQAPIGVTAP